MPRWLRKCAQNMNILTNASVRCVREAKAAGWQGQPSRVASGIGVSPDCSMAQTLVTNGALQPLQKLTNHTQISLGPMSILFHLHILVKIGLCVGLSLQAVLELSEDPKQMACRDALVGFTATAVSRVNPRILTTAYSTQ